MVGLKLTLPTERDGEVFEINPEYSLEYRRQILPYKNPTDFDKIIDGLRKAGLPE